jgi:hypothetical protein
MKKTDEMARTMERNIVRDIGAEDQRSEELVNSTWVVARTLTEVLLSF